jgi:molybdate transport system ATP-binding protein
VTGHLVLSLSVPLDRFRLSVEWETSESSLGVFGHSGAGKTTLLEALAGLRGDAEGRIEMNGRTWLDTARGIRLPPDRRGVGYVPQETLLFPHRNVLGNLLTGARRARNSRGRGPSPERVMEVLELTGLREREVSALSGGERRRVALGRALCSGPDLLLLDEPLSGLDLPLRGRILPYLFRIQEEFGLPTIHVTHDATEITLLAREVVVLDSGRVIARGRPGEVLTSRPIFSMAREEGFENLFRGRVMEAAGATAAVELEPGLRILVPGEGLEAGREAVFGIRAEDLILSVSPPVGLSAQNILPGRILEIRGEKEGAEGTGAVVVVVALGSSGLPVVVTITPQALRQLALESGQKVHLVGKTHACRVLASR